jgi:hypothetical protein
MAAERVRRVEEAQEIARDQLRALVDQLVEGMLPVGSGLAPEDGARLVVHAARVQRHALPVGFHRQLLQVGRKPFQILVVRHDADGLGVEEPVVPDDEQTHEDRQVLFEWRRAEVLVHRVKAHEHRLEVLGADRDHREADGRVHRVPASDPVPELEHVRGVDTELADFFGVGRDRHEVLRHGRVVLQRCERPFPGGVRVGHRLESREGLRRDDEEGLFGIHPRVHSAKSVPSTFETNSKRIARSL